MDADTDEKSITISILDTGLGLSEKDIDKVFERFFRVDSYSEYSISGIGLGLSVVKMICDRLQFEIKVSSKLGEWTLVEVIIPIHKLIV